MLERLQNQFMIVKNIVNALPLQAHTEDVRQLDSSLNQILLEMSVFEANTASSDEMRDAIVKIRSAINQMRSRLDELQSAVAVQYRNHVGSGKESFEALSEEVQAKVNPAAFESKSLFHALVNMGDVLSLFNSNLLDKSAGLEQASRETKPSHPVHIASAPDYDRDPAPPTWSP